MRLIDADNLIAYANNQRDKTVDANDIARMPCMEAVPLKPLAKWLAGYCVAPVPGKLGYPGIEENTHDWEAILRTMDWRTVEHDD